MKLVDFPDVAAVQEDTGYPRAQAEADLAAQGIERVDDGRKYTCPKCNLEKTGQPYPPSPWDKFLRHYMRCGWIYCVFCGKRYKALGRPHHMHRHLVGEEAMKPCVCFTKLVKQEGIDTFGALRRWLIDHNRPIQRISLGQQLYRHLERAQDLPYADTEIDFEKLQTEKMFYRARRSRVAKPAPPAANAAPPRRAPAPNPHHGGSPTPFRRIAPAVPAIAPVAQPAPPPIRPGARSRANSRARRERERSASPRRHRPHSAASGSSSATRCSPPPHPRRLTPQLDENYDVTDTDGPSDNEYESEDDEGPEYAS
ncbi:hypothetical protein AURDEDRAFT_184778 [Auricularia subglabra TFB-10046 SS5]|nr:hypothetical protein AURDEDRAFT_184778 [Auricularia subglabra TFB-10046 SS5]